MHWRDLCWEEREWDFIWNCFILICDFCLVFTWFVFILKSCLGWDRPGMQTQEKQRWRAIQLEDHARGALASHCLRAHWCLTFWGPIFQFSLCICGSWWVLEVTLRCSLVFRTTMSECPQYPHLWKGREGGTAGTPGRNWFICVHVWDTPRVPGNPKGEPVFCELV